MASFDKLWNQHIKPLKGQKVYTTKDKKENFIYEVTDEYLVRVSSNKRKSPKISKAIFEEIYATLSVDKVLSRKYINQNYKGRRSSIIVAVLCILPNVDFTTDPIQLHFVEK